MKAFAFLLVITFVLAAVPTTTNPVVIIGAGAAGAGAARRLADRNIPVIILEARNRLGGRVWTDRTTLGVPADMGAGWIHGPIGNPLTELQRSYNMRIFETNDDSLSRFRSDGTPFATAEYSSSESNYRTFTNNYQAAAQNRITQGLPDTSLENVMRTGDISRYNQEDIQWHIGSNVEFDYGAPAELLSAAFYNSDSKFEGKDVLFPDGYDTMINGLLTRPTAITVRYNTVVTAIDYTNDIILITTTQGNFTAAKVICTIPLGVLKAGDVRFIPALPQAKQTAIANLRTGATNKVFLVFPNTFWSNDQYFGIVTANNMIERGLFNYWLNGNQFTNNANVLVTFGLGQAGYLLDVMSEAEIRNRTTALLGRMFRTTIPQPTRVLVTRWNQDPFAKGAYSYCAVGARPADFDTLASSVDSKLYFAGEHTSRMYRGTVHGALISGRLAADQVTVTIPGKSVINASSMLSLSIFAFFLLLVLWL